MSEKNTKQEGQEKSDQAPFDMEKMKEMMAGCGCAARMKEMMAACCGTSGGDKPEATEDDTPEGNSAERSG